MQDIKLNGTHQHQHSLIRSLKRSNRLTVHQEVKMSYLAQKNWRIQKRCIAIPVIPG